MSRDERPSRSESTSEYRSFAGERGFGADVEAETIRFGCSMLSRIRMQPRQPGSLAVIRCSLGYALHNDDDICRCMMVEGPSGCWKAVPSWRVTRQERMALERAEPAPASPNGSPIGSNGSADVEEAVVVIEVVESAEIVEFRHDEARDPHR